MLAGFPMVDKLTQNQVPVWSISDEEAGSISVPLTKILQRLGASETMNKYADYIALFVALGIVTAPRVMVQLELNKMKAPAALPEKVEGKKNERKAKTVSGSGKKPDSENNTAYAGIPGPISNALDFGIG